MKVTTCCGVPAVSNGDGDTEDIGICPSCHDQCDYIEETEMPDPKDFTSDVGYWNAMQEFELQI